MEGENDRIAPQRLMGKSLNKSTELSIFSNNLERYQERDLTWFVIPKRCFCLLYSYGRLNNIVCLECV